MEKTLAHHVWLIEPSTQKLIKALTAKGAVVRFVGGVVRDSLMGRGGEVEMNEIDLAIDKPPDETTLLLKKANIEPHPIGEAHGTILAVINGAHYEITSLRADIKTDGRHAEVEFTDDWLGDAQRRDFTINAIYADISGEIYDPLNGRADLEKGRLCFIGDGVARIREDYLRILRFFRFFSHIAQGAPDPKALQACVAEKDGLATLSKERLRAEFFKTLTGRRAPEALRLMASCGILTFITPLAERIDFFSDMHQLAIDNFMPDDSLRFFASLYHNEENALKDAQTLKLSNAQKDRLSKILRKDDVELKSYLSIKEVRRLLYFWGVELFIDRVWRAWAADKNPRNGIGWRAMLAVADSFEKPIFPLTGQMVRAAGVPEGPAIGDVMKEVERWWADSDFIEDEFSIIERLKAIVQATIYNER